MTDIIDQFDFEHKGRKFLARVYRDYTMGKPWEEHDGHGDIREGYAEKRAGEVVIGENSFYGRVWLYDFAATIKRAHKEGWGIGDEKQRAALIERCGGEPTRKQVVAEAVRLDMERMRAWLNDKWHWCGVSVVAMPDYSAAIDVLNLHTDGEMDAAIELLQDAQEAEPEENYEHALWGIESDAGDYLKEVAIELADDIIG